MEDIYQKIIFINGIGHWPGSNTFSFDNLLLLDVKRRFLPYSLIKWKIIRDIYNCVPNYFL